MGTMGPSSASVGLVLIILSCHLHLAIDSHLIPIRILLQVVLLILILMGDSWCVGIKNMSRIFEVYPPQHRLPRISLLLMNTHIVSEIETVNLPR